MNARELSNPWHRASYDRFLNEGLPQLLAGRMPLTAYNTVVVSPEVVQVQLSFTFGSTDVATSYDLPQPDTEGVFFRDAAALLVEPIASSEELDTAEINCVGEQLLNFIAERLQVAPAELPWDEALLRSWLPLESWVEAFLAQASPLNRENWLSKKCQLRRFWVPTATRMFTPAHIGRTCPLETAEGPNVGKMLSVAKGAEVRDGKLVIVDENPEATLGLAASLIPFLEHSDAARLTLGLNQMRQWIKPAQPEPALVQTGEEPEQPDFWCGRNLLTAYVCWGVDTFEDAIVVSESCVRRFSDPHPLEPGDLLSNRHGAKGVISRILPDGEMPHLPDGTPADICYSATAGILTRMNFGQLREAIMGRIAKHEGAPAIVPPFGAPGEAELRRRLAAADLPAEGMEVLTMGRDGQSLQRPSTVGWVYWGRPHHNVRDKLHTSVESRPQQQDHDDYLALRRFEAFETIREHFNTRAVRREDAASLVERASAGAVEQAAPPSPAFAEVSRRLAAVGIRLTLKGQQLQASFSEPNKHAIELAHPLPHPWLPSSPHHQLRAIGECPDVPAFRDVQEANTKLQRLLDSQAPASLMEKAVAALEAAVKAFCDALLTPEHLQFKERVQFSARTVLAPGSDLRLDQVGMPEEIAWPLFAPLLTCELGDVKAVNERTEAATRALDEIMARSWVILFRKDRPGHQRTPYLAFHPVRTIERVLRIHPLANELMNADFDGDQMAVFLPITEAGQREAGERLSVAGHLKRDPGLLDGRPAHDALLGLAMLGLTAEGRNEISELIAFPLSIPNGFIDHAAIDTALDTVRERDGIAAMCDVLEKLMWRGFAAAKESGASMSPFFGSNLDLPPTLQSVDPEAWEMYGEEVWERVLAKLPDAAEDHELGPQLLAVVSGARGIAIHITRLLGPGGVFSDAGDNPAAIRHGYRDGLTPEELTLCAISTRKGWARYLVRDEAQPSAYAANGSFHLLARAMRSAHPGPVFARAAVQGEIDPLSDIDSRLFAGLPV